MYIPNVLVYPTHPIKTENTMVTFKRTLPYFGNVREQYDVMKDKEWTFITILSSPDPNRFNVVKLLGGTKFENIGRGTFAQCKFLAESAI